ncbi:unnamed protein product, partial [Amoebophrya sp. A25]|eukprot:GSA25T00024049001.1
MKNSISNEKMTNMSAKRSSLQQLCVVLVAVAALLQETIRVRAALIVSSQSEQSDQEMEQSPTSYHPALPVPSSETVVADHAWSGSPVIETGSDEKENPSDPD